MIALILLSPIQPVEAQDILGYPRISVGDFGSSSDAFNVDPRRLPVWRPIRVFPEKPPESGVSILQRPKIYARNISNLLLLMDSAAGTIDASSRGAGGAPEDASSGQGEGRLKGSVLWIEHIELTNPEQPPAQAGMQPPGESALEQKP